MKKRKIFKKISLAGLAACMFCLPILAGCAPAEMLPEKPTQGQNFDLGLNPETDPVVYTTASGLQIKKSDAKVSSTTTTTTNNGNTHIQDLRGFYYFTMGAYTGTIYTGAGGSLTATTTCTKEPVNWLIIGRSEMPVADSTPAGSAIQGDANKQETAFSQSMYECVNFSSIPEHSDIPKGCFLVLSEKLLGQMYFNSSGALNTNLATNYGPSHLMSASGQYGTRYRYYGDYSTRSKQTWTTANNKGGDLYNYINNLFSKDISGTILNNGLGFTQSQAAMIIPQQLYTCYYDGTAWHQETPSTDGGAYYTMFPLAYRAANSSIFQNFCIEDYLTTNAQRIATYINTTQPYFWYFRSSYPSSWQTYGGYPDGSVAGCASHGSYGVRPAMVMKLS